MKNFKNFGGSVVDQTIQMDASEFVTRLLTQLQKAEQSIYEHEDKLLAQIQKMRERIVLMEERMKNIHEGKK